MGGGRSRLLGGGTYDFGLLLEVLFAGFVALVAAGHGCVG